MEVNHFVETLWYFIYCKSFSATLTNAHLGYILFPSQQQKQSVQKLNDLYKESDREVRVAFAILVVLMSLFSKTQNEANYALVSQSLLVITFSRTTTQSLNHSMTSPSSSESNDFTVYIQSFHSPVSW